MMLVVLVGQKDQIMDGLKVIGFEEGGARSEPCRGLLKLYPNGQGQ